MLTRPYGSLLAIMALLMLPSLGHAQDEDFAPRTVERTLDRKQPGMFHRPRMKTPAEQFSYAQGIEAAGKSKAARKAKLALVHTWRDAPEAPDAQIHYAELLEEKGDYARAFDEYQYLIHYYAGQFPYEDILARQVRIANFIRTQKHADTFLTSGFTAPERALPLYEQIAKNAPGWSRTPEVQFYIGMIHEERKDYELAIKAYEVVQLRYGDSSVASAAAFQRAQCLVTLANINARDEESCRRALSALAGFLRDYPSDPNAAKAHSQLDELKLRLEDMYLARARYYDDTVHNPKAAIIKLCLTRSSVFIFSLNDVNLLINILILGS